MERDIVQKLTEEFAQQVASERQVVYILVELRKLLERKGSLQSYRALGLCCDWAAHPKLDRSSAQEITKLFDQYEEKYRREGVGVSQADIPELVDFCEHTRFRAQLIEACESNGLPTKSPRDDEWWRFFLTDPTNNSKFGAKQRRTHPLFNRQLFAGWSEPEIRVRGQCSNDASHIGPRNRLELS
jgi:hypothetical protein